MSFRNCSDAGRQLAKALAGYKDQQPVILALPRGGVPVAAQVAAALNRLSQLTARVRTLAHEDQVKRRRSAYLFNLNWPWAPSSTRFFCSRYYFCPLLGGYE